MKEYKYKIDGTEYAVKIDKIEGDQAQLEVNGTPYNVEIIRGLIWVLSGLAH